MVVASAVVAGGCACGTGLSVTDGLLEVTPASVDFGEVGRGATARQVVSLRNAGAAVLHVTSGTAPVGFEVMGLETGVDLEPGAKATVTVTAVTTSEGTHTASLVLETDARATPEVLVPLVVKVLGAGIDAGVDGGADAGVDGGADAGVDGGVDAGVDGGVDAGVDAGSTGGPSLTELQLTTTRTATCLRGLDGGLQCWGRRPLNNSTQFTLLPTPLPAPAAAVHVEGGADHLVLLAADGGVWTMGGSVAQGVPGYPIPFDGGWRQLGGLPQDVVQLAGSGWGTCARSASGDVFCWGQGLHTGNGQPTEVPVPVAQLSGVLDLAASLNIVCAVPADGVPRCWGQTSSSYAVGLQRPTDAGTWLLEPQPIVWTDAGVRSLRLSDDHACGLTADGGVVCWGSNSCGQLGNGQMGSGLVQGPQAVALPGTATQVSVRPSVSCALLASGQLWCWGCSQRGDGTLNGGTTPAHITLPAAVRSVASDPFGSHACVVMQGHRVWCWGNNTDGQLGRDGGFLSNLNESPAPVAGYP